MVPTLRHGDAVLVVILRDTARVGAGRGAARVRAGDVVVARFRELPDRLVVKRAVRPVDGGWWLASDNPFAGGDSDSHGVADVAGRVLLRLSPGCPSRVRRAAG